MDCKLYTDTEYAKTVRMDMFEIVKRFLDSDRSKKLLLKCKECGQLYYYEMEESIDWVNGNDPIYRTYYPVDSLEQVEEGKFAQFPRLQYDWLADQKEPKIWWNEGKKMEDGPK